MADRAVLFDLDDTLLLTREVKWAHHRHVAAGLGVQLTDETLRAHWGKPFDEMIVHYYDHVAPLAELKAANAASAADFPKQPVPGAVAVVEALLDAGVVVGVVTSTLTDAARADLARCGFPLERLALVHGSDLTGHHKPDPRVFDAAFAVLADEGVVEVTYVGDALMDEAAARAAGIDFVGVPTGLFAADEFPAGTTVVGSLDDLAPLLTSARTL